MKYNVEMVQVSQLRSGADVVFYGADPVENKHNVLPQYMIGSTPDDHEFVWVVWFGNHKNPFLK